MMRNKFVADIILFNAIVCVLQVAVIFAILILSGSCFLLGFFGCGGLGEIVMKVLALLLFAVPVVGCLIVLLRVRNVPKAFKFTWPTVFFNLVLLMTIYWRSR